MFGTLFVENVKHKETPGLLARATGNGIDSDSLYFVPLLLPPFPSSPAIRESLAAEETLERLRISQQEDMHPNQSPCFAKRLFSS